MERNENDCFLDCIDGEYLFAWIPDYPYHFREIAIINIHRYHITYLSLTRFKLVWQSNFAKNCLQALMVLGSAKRAMSTYRHLWEWSVFFPQTNSKVHYSWVHRLAACMLARTLYAGLLCKWYNSSKLLVLWHDTLSMWYRWTNYLVVIRKHPFCLSICFNLFLFIWIGFFYSCSICFKLLSTILNLLLVFYNLHKTPL